MPSNQTQKRSLTKNLIANYLISASEGRLNPYRPVAPDGLVDFIILDRKTHKTLLCRMKASEQTDDDTEGRPRLAGASGRKNHGNAVFSIRVYDFEALDDVYVVGAMLDQDLTNPKAFWFIPSAYAREHGSMVDRSDTGHTHLVISCSPEPDSTDEWSQFRANTPEELVQIIYRELGEEDALCKPADPARTRSANRDRKKIRAEKDNAVAIAEMSNDPTVRAWFEESVSPKALRFLFEHMEETVDIKDWMRECERIKSRVYSWSKHRQGKSHHVILYSQQTVYLLLQGQVFDQTTWKAVRDLIVTTLRPFEKRNVLELKESKGISIRLWDTAFDKGSEIPRVLARLFRDLKNTMVR